MFSWRLPGPRTSPAPAPRTGPWRGRRGWVAAGAGTPWVPRPRPRPASCSEVRCGEDELGEAGGCAKREDGVLAPPGDVAQVRVGVGGGRVVAEKRLGELGRLVQDDSFPLGKIAVGGRGDDAGGAHLAEQFDRLAGRRDAGLDVVGHAGGQSLLRRGESADDGAVLVAGAPGRERDDQGDGSGELPLLQDVLGLPVASTRTVVGYPGHATRIGRWGCCQLGIAVPTLSLRPESALSCR